MEEKTWLIYVGRNNKGSMQLLAVLKLGRPICRTADSGHPGILLSHVVNVVRSTTDLALAVNSWHRLKFVHRMLKTLQSPRCRKEAACQEMENEDMHVRSWMQQYAE